MSARRLPFSFPRVYASPMLRRAPDGAGFGLADPVLMAA